MNWTIPGLFCLHLENSFSNLIMLLL